MSMLVHIMLRQSILVRFASPGTKMVKITPSRGFAIELGSAMVVAFGSHAG